MTTDRELLEAAARAAGMGPLIWGEFNHGTPLVSGAAIRWNPLTDDGDALRLAVRLHLTVATGHGSKPDFITEVKPSFYGGWADGTAELHGTDPLAATRRAIVRAAAGITPG